MKCNLCPKNCNIDRATKQGACHSGQNATLCRIAPHFWEEPCISGIKGSGAVFFGGCNLHCRFCQNYNISTKNSGIEVTTEKLADVFMYLSETNVANINLVSPSQFSNIIADALQKVKHKLTVPVIYNTNSYEKVSAIKQLDGLIDVYLPDLKFCDSKLAQAMCGQANYFEVATAAITEMLRQQPVNLLNQDNYIQKGVIVRHLVLPGFIDDSKNILDWLAKTDKNIAVSLMAQYFPTHLDIEYPQLNRKLYRHEYQSVQQYFFNVGLCNGYNQQPCSATQDYVPDFDIQQTARLLDTLPHY